MNFKNAIKYLESFVSYERMGDIKYNEDGFNLDRLRKFLNEYSVDFSNVKFVHVTGSKGKGSVCNMIASYLWKSDKSCGLFTSPHMVSVCERFMADGRCIAEDDFADLVTDLENFIVKRGGCDLTYFELTFVIALKWFLSLGLEYVVLEVGLGGRLDATNIVIPIVSVLTRVEKEHTDILGDTIEKILTEKIGIKKAGVPMIIGYQDDEVYSFLRNDEFWKNGVADELVFVEDIIKFDEGFDVKVENTNCAFVALKSFLEEIDISIFSDVLRDFRLVGRQDVRVIDGKTVVFDMAHTKNSMIGLLRFLIRMYPDKEFVFLFSMMKGKAVKDILHVISPLASKIVFTQSHEFRSVKGSELCKEFKGMGFTDADCEVKEDCVIAFKSVLADLENDQVLVITGSHFLVGKIFEDLSLN